MLCPVSCHPGLHGGGKFLCRQGLLTQVLQWIGGRGGRSRENGVVGGARGVYRDTALEDTGEFEALQHGFADSEALGIAM